MRYAVISDSSCLIALINIGRLDLLRAVFGEVMTTPQVIAEVGLDLPDWVRIASPADKEGVERMRGEVDLGEASAIVLALEMPGAVLILDDLAARKAALRFGLTVTGTVGVLRAAKEIGHIDLLRPLLEDLRRVSFRLSDDVIEQVLRSVGE